MERFIEKVEIFSFHSSFAPTPHFFLCPGLWQYLSSTATLPSDLAPLPWNQSSLRADYIIISSSLTLGIAMASHCYWYLDISSFLTGFVSFVPISVNSPFIKFQVQPLEWAIWFPWDTEFVYINCLHKNWMYLIYIERKPLLPYQSISKFFHIFFVFLKSMLIYGLVKRKLEE